MNEAFHKVYFESEKSIAELPEEFAIITAWHPNGEIVEQEKNEKRDARLKALFEAGNISKFRVTGGSRDRAHIEPGWGCVLSLEKAMEIGRLFDQIAIFWVVMPELYLVACLDPAAGLKLVDRLANRWLLCPQI